MNALARMLNERGTLTEQGKLWRTANVVPFLRSPRLRGFVVEGHRKTARLVCGDDGMPVRREPILDDQTWFALQEVLDRNASRKSTAIHVRGSALLGIAYCILCGSKLYADVRARKKNYAYYICGGRRDSGCQCRAVRMDWLEDQAVTRFLDEVGDVEMEEKITIAADTHEIEKAQIREAQKAMIDGQDTVWAGREAEYDQVWANLAEQLALRAMPAKPAEVTYRKTGKTYRQLWDATTDTAARRRLMQTGWLQSRGRQDRRVHGVRVGDGR